MKQLKYVFLLALICITTSILAQSTEKEQLTVALSSPGKPYKLRVELITGSIKVTGHTADNIQILADADEEKQSKAKDKTKEGLKRIGGSGGFEIKAIEKKNEIVINNNSISRKVDIELKVPQNGTLILKTVNQGDIVVTNVKGELEISNINGDIKLSGITGSAVATTTNGDIDVSFNGVTDGKPMAFSTFNGDVNISLPASAKANLKMKTDQGEIYSDFEVAVEKGNTAPVKSSTGGVYKISKDSWVSGKINGGGAEMMIKSWSGDLVIRKAKQ